MGVDRVAFVDVPVFFNSHSNLISLYRWANYSLTPVYRHLSTYANVASDINICKTSNFLWFAGLLNLRGSDIEHNPVFFSYVILTQTQLQLYMMKEDRITLRIENHFSQESIDVIVKEYNGTLAGINNVVCMLCRQYFVFSRFSSF